ncbi:MAG: MIP family channel protein [Trueperaceae bacterium]|nr:MAG: MIP family channel protein [Trueperaceae bacterium]
MNTKAWIAEFIGTFALVFIGVGAIASAPLAGSGLVGIALAHGLTIAVMVSATGAVSGGHLNPAVTIGLLTTGKIDAGNAVGYIVSQCLGGVVAVLLLLAAIPEQVRAVGIGTPALADGVGAGSGLLIEIVLTFFLVFVIYGSAVDKRAPKMGGLFIGLTVTLDILMGGPLTGAAMNPARHLGPALFAGSSFAGQIWLYWLGPVVGGVLAAQFYARVLEERSEA